MTQEEFYNEDPEGGSEFNRAEEARVLESDTEQARRRAPLDAAIEHLREMTATPPRREGAYGYAPEPPAPQDTTGSYPVIEELRQALKLTLAAGRRIGPSLWYCDGCQGPSDQPTVLGLCPSCASSWAKGGRA
jgi:hypothetical protein